MRTLGFTACIFLGISCLSARAQGGIELTWGPAADRSVTQVLTDLFLCDSAAFCAITSDGKRDAVFTLHRFDTDSMKRAASRVLALPDAEGRQAFFLEPLRFGDRAFILATTEDEGGEDIYFYAYPVDGEFLFPDTPHYLGTVNRSVMVQGKYYNFAVSEAGGYMAFIASAEPDNKRNEKFTVRLFDREFRFISEKDLEVPYTSGEMAHGSVLLDGDRAVWFLKDVPSVRVIESDKVSAYARDFILLKYSFHNNALTEKALSIGTKWIYEARLAKNKAGHIQVFGYYSNMIDPVMAGTFSVAFHPETGEITDSGLSSFDRTFKARFRSAGGAADRPDLALFHLNHAFPMSDNHMLMVSEKIDVFRSTVFNPATGTYFTVENYAYEEILLTRLSPSGQGLSFAKIPKFQNASRSDETHLSYAAHTQGGDVLLLYNDHERNAALDVRSEGKYSSLSGRNNAQAVLVRYRPDGALSKQVLFKNSPSGGVLSPRFTLKTPAGLVLYTEGYSGGQFVHLSFQGE